MEAPPRVAVFRTTLLARSESFIRNQGEALKELQAYYVGARDARDEPLPPARSFILGQQRFGRIRDIGFKLTRTSRLLTRHLRSLKSCVVLAHFGPDGALILPTALSLRTPLVTYFHGFDACTSDEAARQSYYLHRSYVRHRSELQAHGALFLAVSEFIRNRLIAQGYSDDRIRVAPIGIDTEYFTPPTAEERLPVVLFVGRFSAEKGAIEAIHVARELQNLGVDAELVMLGDGPERPAAERLAMELNCRCRFEGMVPSTRVREWMRAAKVLCVPSLPMPTGEAEGFGLVAAEAQSSGLPVVAYATGGLPEAVENGRGGYVVPCGARAAMVEAVQALLANDALNRRQGREGRARVTRLYNLASRTRELERILQTVAQPATRPLPERKG